MNRFKRLFFAALALILAGAFALAQDAAPQMDALSIVERSRNRIEAETTSTRSRMVITARGGAVTERVMDQFSKQDASGNNRTLIVFHEPASVRGTRFLTIENPGRDNDQWIFLPGLNRVRRIAAAEGSGSFVGSDFSYDDIAAAARRIELDTHRFLRTERLHGRECYVIESIPKDAGFQYSKMIQWIDRETFVPHKIELFDRRGTLVKILEILELREVQGRLSPMVTRMSTLASGSSTTINVMELRYDAPIPEGVFTTNFLQTGRP